MPDIIYIQYIVLGQMKVGGYGDEINPEDLDVAIYSI